MRGVAVVLALAAGCFWAPHAWGAGPQVADLARKLVDGGDFRVRTQAALALGASGSPQAVTPLCGALKDENVTVRAAAAAALGRLALGGKQCLARRFKDESNKEVRSVIQRALQRLAPPEPKLGPDTQLYVAIGKIDNDSDRPNAEIDGWVRGALEKHFGKRSGVVTAPQGEREQQARRRLKSFPNIKAVFLLPKVKLAQVAGGVQLRLEVALFTYPGKALKGTINRKLTMPDTPLTDTASIKELVEMAADRLVPDVERTASRI